MTEIKESLQRLRQASIALEQQITSSEHDTKLVHTLHRTLTEINDNVESLRTELDRYTDSPIQLRT